MTAVMMVGCQINEINNEAVSSDNVFTAEMETFGDQTKTAMTSDLEVVWSKGDQLTIFRGSYLGDRYQVDNQFVGKPYGDFKLVGEESSGNDFSSGTELPANIAVYPYNKNLTVAKDGNGYTVSGVEFPSMQEYAVNSFPDESFIMAAVTTSLSDHKLKFKNIGAALKLQLKGAGTVKTISVKGNNNEDLAGTADVTVSAGATPAFAFTSSSKEVTLDCGANGVELNSGEITDFIISLPVVNFTKGFTVTVTDVDGNTEEISTSNPNEVQRSFVLRMPEKTVAFEVEAPDEPTQYMYYGHTPADIITKYNLTAANPNGFFSNITEDCIKECVEKGYMIETDAKAMGKTSFGIVPKNSLIVIAVPSSSNLIVKQDNGFGAQIDFTVTPTSNGEQKTTVNGISYDLYGQLAGITYNNNGYFYVNNK